MYVFHASYVIYNFLFCEDSKDNPQNDEAKDTKESKENDLFQCNYFGIYLLYLDIFIYINYNV